MVPRTCGVGNGAAGLGAAALKRPPCAGFWNGGCCTEGTTPGAGATGLVGKVWLSTA